MSESKEQSDSQNDATAQFYRPYCDTEKKYFGTWHHDKQVAENSKTDHEANNPGHTVTIKSK